MKKLIVTMLSLAALVGVTWAADPISSDNFVNVAEGTKYPNENTPRWTTKNTETNSVVKASEENKNTTGGWERSNNYLAIEDSSAGGLVRDHATDNRTIFFDSVVKMTPADSVPEYDTESDKLIVFLWEQENDVTTTTENNPDADEDESSTTTTLEVTTNLVVLARNVADGPVVTNIIDNSIVKVKVGEWHRLLIKTVEGAYQVWVSKGPTENDMVRAKTEAGVDTFYSIQTGNTVISSVGFQGTGSLNQLAFYAEDPLVRETYDVEFNISGATDDFALSIEGPNNFIGFDGGDSALIKGLAANGSKSFSIILPYADEVGLTVSVGASNKIEGWDDYKISDGLYLRSITTESAGSENITIVVVPVGSITPTVITVASVGNVTDLTVDGLTAKFKVPGGYSLTSITIGGTVISPLPTLGDDGFYTFTATEAGSVVIATQKDRIPAEHAWWENPTVVKTTTFDNAGDAGPFHFGIGGDYAAISTRFTGGSISVFELDDLIDGNGSVINYYAPGAQIDGVNTSDIRGAAVCPALNVALTTCYKNGKFYSIPLTDEELVYGENVFEITNDKSYTFDRAYFSPDGKYLFTSSNNNTDQNRIIKWEILNGLKTSGVNLKFIEEKVFSERVRDMAYARTKGNKDIVYAALDGTAGIEAYNFTDGGNVVKIVKSLSFGFKYGSIAVSQTKTDNIYLTVLETLSNDPARGPITVFKLKEGGMELDSQVISLTNSQMANLGMNSGSYGMSAVPTDDNGTLLLGNGGAELYAIQYSAPIEITASVTGGTMSTEATNGKVIFKSYDTKTIVFTPTEGYELSTVIVNGNTVADAALVDGVYTYTYSENDTSVAVTFVEAKQPTVTVTSVTIAAQSDMFEVVQGGSITLEATVVVTPDENQYKGVTWSSADNTGKVTVSDTGVVTVATGATVGDTFVITATSTQDDTKSDTVTIKVKAKYPSYIPADDTDKQGKFDTWKNTNASGATTEQLASDTYKEAFLLNVAPTAEALAAAKADFKIPSITVKADGTVKLGDPTAGKSYNGTVTIKASATVNGDYNLQQTDAAARFFKAVLE